MRNINKGRESYVNEYLENSQLVHFRDLDFKKYHVRQVLYKDLPSVDMKGYFPIASDYVDSNFQVTSPQNGDLCFYFLPSFHELYIGTTGSGKTTGCVEPQLRAISSVKNKPNLFISDPKGELFERNAQHLKQHGYKIFLLNFKDGQKSDRWNPLLEIYDEYQKLTLVGKTAVFRVGAVDPTLILYSDANDFEEEYLAYDGYAFASGEALEDYISYLKDNILMKVEDLVTQFANMVVPTKSVKDPTWEDGANRLFRGLIYALLEDSIIPEYQFTRDMMTLKTIRDLYNTLRDHINSVMSSGNNYSLKDYPPLNYKPENSYSLQLMRQTVENANGTTRSYLGVFETSVQKWLDFKILSLTTGHTIHLDGEAEPFAIFLVTRDYEKSDFLVAGLFIDWVYRVMLEKKERKETDRELHFFLDEFGNIPEIRDFENKIATSRSRNIWFHLVIQSYSQLSYIYDYVGPNRSSIIKDNCNAQIFLGAQHYETKEIFSKECGEHSILSFDSLISADRNQFESVRLIPVSKLDHITPGEMYIKRLFSPVIKSSYIRSYLCKEFQKDNRNGFDIITPNNTTFGSKCFQYVIPKKKRSNRNKNFDFDDL